MMKSITIDEARKIITKWSLPIIEEDKQTVLNYIHEYKSVSPITKHYLVMLKPYFDILGISRNNTLEEDCLACGIAFFTYCLIFIMHFKNWRNHVRDIFLYNLLYLLVDHYIDNINIDQNIKNQSIKQMFILIENPEQYKKMLLIDPILKTISKIYLELITRCPGTKSVMIKIFRAEIEGLKIQNNPNLDRKSYYDICLNKGGYTVQVLNKIIECDSLEMFNASYNMGAIMQLIDDCVDIELDRKNKINTIATHEVNNLGNIDNLWIDIVNRIENIHSDFPIIKIIYITLAVYIVDRIPKYLSEDVKQITQPLNLFNFDGSNLLVESLMAEINTMEILNDN